MHNPGVTVDAALSQDYRKGMTERVQMFLEQGFSKEQSFRAADIEAHLELQALFVV